MEISGKDFRDEHPENIPNIFLTFLVFHLDILGNRINDLQSLKMALKSLTLLIFHLDISGKNFNDLQL